MTSNTDTPPAAPPPTEERLFTNWSSEDSPRERANQQLQSARSIESRRTTSQTEQIERESGDVEELRHIPVSMMTVPSTQEQTNQVGARLIDHETNTTDVETRLPRDEVRTDVIQTHNQGIQVPSSSGELSSHSMYMEESLVRSNMPNNILQLDGPTSVCTRRRQPLPIAGRTTIPGDGYPDDSNSDSHNNRFCEDRKYLARRRYHEERGGRTPDRENNQGQGYPGRGGPPANGGPPDDGGPPDNGGPPDDGGLPDDGGPPDDEGPPGDGRPPRRPRRQGLPGPPRPPGPVHPIIVQQPQVTLDTYVLENTFGTVGQSMLQLARAQDQTNRYLQEHLQQGQMNMQVHTGALQQLATSNYQRNFDHIFASIPIYDGSNREDFFPWLECLEAACFYSGRNIKTEALGRSAGPVQNVIMALPNACSWKAIREELKRCFSDQTSLGHTATQLENMTQKPNEPLRLYIFRYSKIHKSVTKQDACYDTDPSRWFRFLTSITYTTIADKITRSENLPTKTATML